MTTRAERMIVMIVTRKPLPRILALAGLAGCLVIFSTAAALAAPPHEGSAAKPPLPTLPTRLAAGSAATWKTTLQELGAHPPGQILTVDCPADGAIGAPVWGTDLYTSDSAICSAAVHAGQITVARGGKVTLQAREGAASFPGTARRGVLTLSWGRWGAAFSFQIDKHLLPKPGEPMRIQWTTTAQAYLPGASGPILTVLCPANGAIGAPIWGSGPYTTDSAICPAAVHAGAITVAKGGRVTIVRVPGLSRYESTARNGVQTSPWGAYPTAFQVK